MIALALTFALLFFVFRALARTTYDPIAALWNDSQSNWHYAYAWLTVLSFLGAAITLIAWAYRALP